MVTLSLGWLVNPAGAGGHRLRRRAVRRAVRAVRLAVRAVRRAVWAVRRAVRAVKRAVRAVRRTIRAVRQALIFALQKNYLQIFAERKTNRKINRYF